MYWRSANALRCCALGAVLAWLAACTADPGSPEEDIRRLIDTMEEAAESGSASQVAVGLHPAYADDWYPNKSAATRALNGFLRRQSDVHLFSIIKSVELLVEEEGARSVVYLAMSRVPVDSVETLLAIKADLYRLDIELRLSDGEWLVSRAQWQRANPRVL